jgi:hypothetical protein
MKQEKNKVTNSVCSKQLLLKAKSIYRFAGIDM